MERQLGKQHELRNLRVWLRKAVPLLAESEPLLDERKRHEVVGLTLESLAHLREHGEFERKQLFKSLTLFEEGLHLCGLVVQSLQGLQEVKRALELRVHDHHRGFVVELAAVIWRTEDGYEVTVAEKFVAFFDDLVRPANQINVVLFQKLLDLELAERVADASVVLAPVLDCLVWIGPQEITEHAFIRDVCGPCDLGDVFDLCQVWTQAAMHS